MKFWDSSALVHLLVNQAKTEATVKVIEKDPVLAVAWTTEFECFSALCRLEREGKISARSFNEAHLRLKDLALSWNTVVLENEIGFEIKRILRLHPLRCADSIQLASAILVSNRLPHTLEFISFDEDLTEAASKEGFEVLSL